MDWIKGKPGGRGSQEDRKTERQSVSQSVSSLRAVPYGGRPMYGKSTAEQGWGNGWARTE